MILNIIIPLPLTTYQRSVLPSIALHMCLYSYILIHDFVTFAVSRIVYIKIRLSPQSWKSIWLL